MEPGWCVPVWLESLISCFLSQFVLETLDQLTKQVVGCVRGVLTRLAQVPLNHVLRGVEADLVVGAGDQGSDTLCGSGQGLPEDPTSPGLRVLVGVQVTFKLQTRQVFPCGTLVHVVHLLL